DVRRLLELRGERRPSGEAETAADDSVRTEHAEREIRDVHRTAPANTGAGRLAVKLGHHWSDADSLGDRMAMAAMRGRNQVARFKRGAAAGRYRLFADIGMRKARHAAREIVGTDALLELADGHHSLVYLEKLVSRRQAGIASDSCGSAWPLVVFF